MPKGLLDVPFDVADALNPIDMQRVMSAAAAVVWPYLYVIAICQVLIRTRSLAPKETT